MYKPGTIEVDSVIDSQQKYETSFSAYLPHSCDEWVIGGPEEIKMMIEDLNAILKQFPEKVL